MEKSGRIGIMRDAFTPYNAKEYPLHSTIATLGEGKAAVHSGAALHPQGIVVDEYIKDTTNGVYRLTNVATDLLRWAPALTLPAAYGLSWLKSQSKIRGGRRKVLLLDTRNKPSCFA